MEGRIFRHCTISSWKYRIQVWREVWTIEGSQKVFKLYLKQEEKANIRLAPYGIDFYDIN